MPEGYADGSDGSDGQPAADCAAPAPAAAADCAAPAKPELRLPIARAGEKAGERSHRCKPMPWLPCLLTVLSDWLHGIYACSSAGCSELHEHWMVCAAASRSSTCPLTKTLFSLFGRPRPARVPVFQVESPIQSKPKASNSLEMLMEEASVQNQSLACSICMFIVYP